MKSDQQISAARRITLALAGLLAFAGTGASASEMDSAASPQATIETRQAGFKKMGEAMKAIVAEMKKDSPSGTQIAPAVAAIRTGAEAALRWFPPGSGPDSGTDTDALPYIWQERARFDALASKLVAESKMLSTLASGNDVAALRAQVKTVGEICSTCHRSFRAD